MHQLLLLFLGQDRQFIHHWLLTRYHPFQQAGEISQIALYRIRSNSAVEIIPLHP